MAEKKKFPNSEIPIRKSVDFLPEVFKSDNNDKFLSGVFDPLIQPGVVDKLSGYVGRRYGKTYKGSDVYLDTDATLRSRYQLEPGVTIEKDQKVENFYDYLDFKNILKYFGNASDRDDKITYQEHYSWNPPIDWDKFVNYREYYWAPAGPPTVPIEGQAVSIVSTYKVNQGIASTWVFTPDGFTNNPDITLYRGQTYKFNVNSPGEAFTLRTNYDTGSLNYDPLITYFPGQLAVYDGKLWRARTEISPADGSSIDINSQDWELIDSSATFNSLLYNNGVTNNGIEVGTLTFEVPLNAPDVVYYQSETDPNRLGRFIIADIDSNTFIDVEKEIIGKANYKSSNGVELSNGLLLEFRGQVAQEKYSEGAWLVEGVGKEISLIKFSDLVPPILTTDVPEILFDNEGFDTQPFDDAAQYPSQKDYITINRSSKDSNPWSRYNRWFHRSVLEYSYRLRGVDFDGAESSRAKRPIIEFHPNIQLFNHGGIAKTTVDYVDDYTTDVFSTIEGSSGYSIDGEFLFQGARILVTADTDSLSNNKIYEVNFVKHNNRTQINLKETADSNSVINECVLVRRGIKNSGKMYDFNGTSWELSQEKTKVNQQPLFDAYDKNGVSFADADTYPVSSFVGSPILSYTQGNSVADVELGFSLSYLNIDNVGDIQFNWNWDNDTFSYTIQQTKYTKNINTGYYKVNSQLDNGWILTDKKYLQPIIDSYKVEQQTNQVIFNTVDWNDLPETNKINFYLNGEKFKSEYTRQANVFEFEKTFNINDIVSIKIVADIEPDQGYYEIPVGLEKNPLNENLKSFTFGQAADHVRTAIEFDDRFVGALPGVSNLRDLSDFQQHGLRFLKHSGLSAVATAILCDKEINLIKSLQYAKKQYSIFKDNFLKKSIEIEFLENPSDFVDKVIEELTRTKTVDSPFADSDMIGSGAYTSIKYIVEDTGIKTFSLSEKFDLNTLSRKAVYIYVNNQQKLAGRDYEFNSTFGYVSLLIDLNEGDSIEIREYVSTAFSHIPPTPTSMGLYKKYTPMKFVDDTYREPLEVIQGHDGSITIAFGDFRDELLLELEYRIYNNIKQEYEEKVFDIDANLGGYYGNALFTKNEQDAITNQEFLKWVANTNIGYTENEYLKENEPFTYTYSNMSDPTRTQNLPGWWRGVYDWFYDTDRPHRCPWEMLGFSEKPTWWENEYGAAPYTSENLLLWEDLRDGIIRQGPRAGTYDRYKRSSLLNHLPCDCDGNLLNPLDSGLATNYTLVNNKGGFKLGDVSPTEYAYRSSSEFPFVKVIALCLLRPFEFIIANFDRSKTKRNVVNQLVATSTDTFITVKDLLFPIAGTRLSSGLSTYIASYIKYKGKSVEDTAQDKISNINVRLSSRLSGFVDSEQQKYLLDSKSPNSASSSIFVPTENYNIIFNVSSPIASISYSGIIFEKTEGGWVVNGYDDVNPYFNYYPVVANQKDPVITIGGVSDTFVNWEPNQLYNNGQIVEYRNTFYRAKKTHTGTDLFDGSEWVKLPELPIKGGVTAQRRRNFNKFLAEKLSYGTKLTSVQQVVDFMLGYQAWLEDQGFVFENYDSQNQVVQDFITGAKEFMFWTRHDWAIGSLITISPGAQSLSISTKVGVGDNLLDSFYEYNILKDTGEPLDAKNINVLRGFQTFKISTVNTTAGIFYLKVNYVLKEHVTIFDDKTVFNDVIFDKTTGYRQERIKSNGFRTTDWDGDYTSPGFLFDNVQINVWKPFTDYRLGDIVSYKSYNYTSKFNHTSGQNFDDDRWTRLDSTPKKQLIPNYDYRINQIEDYFNVSSQGLGQAQRDLARHTIGYQTRDYLQNLAEDEVTQFRLYQGFIREKGTGNSITKLFDKVGRSIGSSVSLEEEWAFKLGEFGGSDQSYNIEINLETEKFVLNPQPLIVVNNKNENFVDRYYRVSQEDFDYAPFPYTVNINPVSSTGGPIRTAGYVKVGQAEHVVRNKSDILNLDITTVSENDHIWITFNNQEWTVLRANYVFDLPMLDISTQGNTVTISFDKRHNLVSGDYIGITTISEINGFHEIKSVTPFSLSFDVETVPEDNNLDSTSSYPLLLTEARFNSYDSMDPGVIALLSTGSRLFVDNNPEGLWEVVEKTNQYNPKLIENVGISSPTGIGTKVLYADSQKQSIVSLPSSGYVACYLETPTGLSVKQILQPLDEFVAGTIGSFGQELAISPDNKWLAIGSPRASGIRSNFKGIYNTTANYASGDIVLYAGTLWKAQRTVLGDGSSISIESEDWNVATNIQALETGSSEGYDNQGMISLYEYSSQQWNLVDNFVSPNPEGDKLFGSKIVFAKSGSDYSMAVSAPGNDASSKGRVYLYKYDTTNGWVLNNNPNYKGIYETGGTLSATEIKPGRTYTISSTGTTNFFELGADNNSPGTVFVATEAGSGTGTVTQDVYYPKGSIVYYAGYLWQATADNRGDGSTISLESNDWLRLDPVNTSASLPQSVSIQDDGSTLASGILSSTQLAELIKEGDEFGSSLAMNYDGSILAIGSAKSDGQYFANYRGIWQSNFEYIQGDVVSYEGGYYKLVNEGEFSVGADSTIRSYNQSPDEGLPWSSVGDSSSETVGKVFVYKKNSLGGYTLLQTITADSLSELSDIQSGENISSGDLFGFDIDLDYAGTTLVVTSPKADKNFQNQGSAYVFRLETDSTWVTSNFTDQTRYRLKQKLESYGIYPNEYFGQSICIAPNTGKIVIGAKNTTYSLPVRFDSQTTTFDNQKTTYKGYTGFTGAVYVFERKNNTYFLTEKLNTELSPNESFGYSISCTDDVILVGSPKYISPGPHGPGIAFEGDVTGTARLFRKDTAVEPLTVLSKQAPTVDIENIKRISLYDTDSDVKIQDLELIDPAKLKILAAAERNLSFKTPYDPAIYNIGTEDVTIDPSIAWRDKNVGKLWWNISTAKWLYYEQGDIAYRTANWGSLAEGASIDVYEWVASKLLPSEWSSVADTTEGINLGISGQPLYPNDDVYSFKELYNENTGLATETIYYYWVKGKTITPNNVLGRTESSATVANLIQTPGTLGNTFVALTATDKILFYNYRDIVSSDNTILNVEYYNSKNNRNAVHNEYQLLTEGVEDSLPAGKLETKWIDSLVGYDQQGNRIPDPNLPEKQKYGILFRPRQSMFVNRKSILKTIIENTNSILKKEAFADTINFNTLNLVDPQPAQSLSLYDTSVSTYVDLNVVGTTRVKQAVLSVNIIDNEVSSINIVDPGFGYKPTELFDQEIPGVYLGPKITIQGNGSGAEAACHIDSQGRIITVVVTNKGKKYSYAEAIVRRFSVLVENDVTANNYWSIYAWDDVRKTFFRSASQGYDTTKYWSYVDWWDQNYGPTSRIIKEIDEVSVEPSIKVELDDLIRIKEYGSGGWAVFRKISESSTQLLGNYKLVGRQNGTIKLSENLYNITVSGVGYDNISSFDTGFYDLEPTQELRNILKTIKEDIFIGDYAVEWNKLFFSSVRYVFHEQTYVDWAFKTSFLNAVHNVGEFKQTPNYRNDSLESYIDYINEVKPYRTTVREYISKYTRLEQHGAATSDFDLPVVYSESAGKNIVVNENNDNINSYPWKWWSDNKGYSIIRIDVALAGSGYTSAPKVVIEGNGSGATAQAYVSNGKVSGITIINQGSGYTTTPTISLVGGNGTSTDNATAVAILGNNKARTFSMSVKFDRITKTGLYENFTDSQKFTASGNTAVFDLKYAPTRDKTKIILKRNSQLVLANEYTISLYKSSTDTFGLLKGKITFEKTPDAGDLIEITYEKNDELYDAVNRIEKSYSPTTGMKGKELEQLMTGIDFGGVQIQGTTFDVTGGWDALPWFTDSWDSVQASSDYYVVCDGSTEAVTLPYVPAVGQEINIYLKRAGQETLPTIDNLQYSDAVSSPRVIRIDDPFYDAADDSSTGVNPNAEMPTFEGDGVTNVIEIGRYIEVSDGDILIFRPIESDGAVTITDPNIVDTNITGGSLSTSSALRGAYSTATGTLAEEILIDGGQYIQPDQVPAPEENIPGQVLDGVSIKVFNTVGSGAATLQSRVIVSDGSTSTYDINQNVLESKSVIVYVDSIKKELNTDYIVDLKNNRIEFTTAPDIDKIIEILSIGIGGISILDYQEFTADGETQLFLTNANFNETTNIFVTVDGIETDAVFRDSTGVVDTVNRTLVEFGNNPGFNSTIKIICLGVATDVDSSLEALVRVNQQTIVYDGSTRSYDLDNFVKLSRESSLSSMIVELNGTRLQGVDTIYAVYDGTNNQFTLGVDPVESAGAILSSNIKVFINGELKTFIQDYVYDGSAKSLTIESSILTVGDVIKIENDLRSKYLITENNIVISSDVTLVTNDIIEVTWFSEYPSMQIASDELTGGKVVYQLPFKPLSVSYVWVYLNGNKLIQDIDYSISLPRGVIYLNQETSQLDKITFTVFGTDVFKLPSAYEINKDMLNIYRYNRYSSSSEVKLASALNYYDTEIKITDATTLFDPIRDRNVAGMISINGERIQYLKKEGNTLSQLRRGIHGTAIKEIHPADTYVVDISKDQTIPYTETQERADFVSDGSSLLIGPLDYIPLQASSTTWSATTIPTDYGRCDTVEVFVGGKRLRKTPLTVFDETLGATSPAGDRTLDAEFSVDGVNPYIRLTTTIPAGTRITVIKRVGQTWYDRGETTASSGVTLLANESSIGQFIAAKTTRLPE